MIGFYFKTIKNMEQEIIEGNKLIAEFMGKITGIGISLHTFNKYHTSWDWLMPVVEKIEGLGYVVEISNGYYLKNISNKMFYKCKIFTYKEKEIIPFCDVLKDESKQEVVWLAVVEFIKWYNQNKK